MRFRTSFAAALTVMAGLAASTASAGSIVEYELFGVDGASTSVAPTLTADGSIGDGITRGAGLTGASSSNSFNSAGWDDLSGDDYIQFGFQVAAGYTAAVDQLIFATRSSGTGPGFVDVSYSIDGADFVTLTTLAQQGTNYLNSVLDLNQVIQSSLVIRFTAANDTSANGGTIGSAGTFRLSDYSPDGGQTYQPITITGDLTLSAVPEPSSVVLCGLGLGLSGLYAARARRKQTA
jgi:hypothetical protein